ncbi:hypothetical protein ACIB24_08270 [Spongisporangium articulatum]|uniref:Helix-turn-helix domain-containing protein n=1 Tax=Spongisporangium articulatum TaxID=3362603 RepID=A0ABW8AL19_9ACTN
MSELTGPSPEVPSDENTDELVDLDRAASLIGVQPDRVEAMVEEGLLHPVDPSQAEPQFRVEEVKAVAMLGG